MEREMEIRSVAIVGAGAMGAAYASLFAEASGFSTSFVADGKRYQKLRRQQLVVNGRSCTIPVQRPEEIEGGADLLIVALKHHHLRQALPLIEAAVGPHTIILSVMNGLESEEIIGEVCGIDKMVWAIAVGIDAVREGHRFSYARSGKIIFGIKDPAVDRGRVARLARTLESASISYEIPEDIERSLWWKFMVNVGINQASALLRAPYALFQCSAEARELMLQLMREVVALAKKSGVDLSEADLREWLAVLDSLSPEGKTSMLQDIEAQRKTEVEIFAGAVVNLAKKHALPAPANALVLNALRAMEEWYGKHRPVKEAGDMEKCLS